MEAVELWVLEGRPVDAGRWPEGAGHAEGSREEVGLVERAHVVEHLHAVQEDTVNSLGHLAVALLQLLEMLALLLVLFLQGLDVLTVDPDGKRRRPVQNLLQLGDEDRAVFELSMS